MKRSLLAIMAAVLLMLTTAACNTLVSANPAEMEFADVPDGGIWGQAISYVYSEGYMVGKSSDSFDPHSPITRAEVAVLMLRAKHGTEYVPSPTEGSWWAPWVAEAEKEGLLEEGIAPDSPATRADIATLIWLLEH